MKLDSEKQRKALLGLLGQVPVSINLESFLAGPHEDIVGLVKAIQEAPLEDGTPSPYQGKEPQKIPEGSTPPLTSEPQEE